MQDTTDLDLKKTLIKKQTCFSQFNQNEIDMLAALFKEKQFTPGEIIVIEGDPVDSVYIIIRGLVDVQHITIQDGKSHIESLATLSDGDAIGLNETGFYSLSGMRTATVVARTDVTALRLSVAEFHGFTLANPHINSLMRKQAKEISD